VSGVRESTVGEGQNGPASTAPSAIFSDYSRNFLALVTDGHVPSGTRASKPSQRVETGQRLEIDVPEAAPAGISSQDLPLPVLYEDADVVVIDKPAGLVVHPAAGHANGTLVNALLFHVKDLSGVGGEIRPGIVHRLDKDTSGVMVIAKHDAAHRKLTESWNTERVRKEYVALVYGTPSNERGTIDAPIGRDPRDRKRMAVVASGRCDHRLRSRRAPALRVARALPPPHRRTHQIRVH
jgi:23S rRNA pseudouridine1911/1915/1917 synthase